MMEVHSFNLKLSNSSKKVIAYDLRNIYTHHTCHCTAASKILCSGNDVSPINQKDRLGKTIFLNVHGVIGVAYENRIKILTKFHMRTMLNKEFIENERDYVHCYFKQNFLTFLL